MMTEYVDIQHVDMKSTGQIIEITDSLVVPVLYDTLLIDRFAPVHVQKAQFVNQILPAILLSKYQLEHNISRVKALMHKLESGDVYDSDEFAFADSLMLRFRASSYQNLIDRMKPHSNSLVLAQAVIESGWGRSRFAAEANNLFGVWTSHDDEYSIASLKPRSGKQVYLKKYDNILESVDHYFLNIGRHNAYRNFRSKRLSGANNYELISALSNYSEEGSDYTAMLQKIIRWNNFEKFDHYVIHPDYIINRSKFEEYRIKYSSVAKEKYSKYFN